MTSGKSKNKGNNKISTVPHELREHVSESFNVFQSSIAMIAILDGFLFSSLVQFLSMESLTIFNKLSIWLMTLSLILNTGAIMTLHTAAHQVINHCQFFYPKSRMIVIGRNMMDLAFLFMFSAISVMLLAHSMFVLSLISFISGIFACIFRRISKRTPISGKNIIQVD